MTVQFSNFPMILDRYSATKMSPIDTALKVLHSSDEPNISAVARKYKISRSNLTKRFNGVSQSAVQKNTSQQLLTPQQERTLVDYINKLTQLGLPPTPSMVHNFAYDVVKQQPGKNWSQRFCQRWSDTLLSRYLKPIDSTRKIAESKEDFEHWFSLLSQKIEQYGIEPQNIYNMDEKGFLIGFLTKAKRIFTKQWYESDHLLGNIQDGNREWVTLVATICADGTALPPGLIYMAKTGDIQDSWVQDLDADTHTAQFASSPSGWTNDELGFEWLVKIFDQHSKTKARNGRDWRLLIIDGHGSHVNMRFLDWCAKHFVLVAVYPPHSTHRLQPLDVSLFAPLAIYYSQELDAFLHRSQGLSQLTKRDFFALFWKAYTKAFNPDTILSGWSSTGLHPLDPLPIMKLFGSQVITSPRGSAPTSPSSSGYSAISGSDWRSIRALVNEVVTGVHGQHDKKVQKLHNTILHLTTENALLRTQNDGFKQALFDEKKKRKRGRGLFEEVRAQDGHGATFFSPKKIKAAKDLQLRREEVKEQEQRNKAAQKEARNRQRQQAQIEKEGRAAERARKAVEKKETVALKARQRQLAIEGKHTAQHLRSTHVASVRKAESSTKQAVRLQKPAETLDEGSSCHASKQPASRFGRTRRLPRYLAGYQLDT